MQGFCRRVAVGSLGGLMALTSTAPSAVAQTGSTQESVSQTERLAYTMMVGGLHVGDAIVDLDQSPEGYSSGLKLTTRGLAKALREFRADISGEGAFRSQDDVVHPVPASFKRDWSGGEIESSMLMTWDPVTRMTNKQERYVSRETGEEVAHEDLPWNKNDTPREREEERKRQVPEALRIDTLDPMAAFIAARQQVIAMGAAKSPVKFRVPVYDGQRRYDIVGTTAAPRITTINEKSYEVIAVNATLVPLAGFSTRGEERMRKSRGKLLFTADDRFIPVQVTIENEFLTGVMNLAADCRVAPEGCAPPQAAAN